MILLRVTVIITFSFYQAEGSHAVKTFNSGFERVFYDSIVYDASITPNITTVNPTTESVAGKTTNLNTSSVSVKTTNNK